MKTETDENYLKEIYQLELDHQQVTTSMLARRFGFAPATVTGQLKKLAQLQLVEYSRYQGVSLTETGRAIALEVIRHHRLIETYLATALGIPWDRVHIEAEKLEHVISEYLESKIDEYLGHPEFDPHGSPIPANDGSVTEHRRLRLAELEEGSVATIVEVYDRDPALLSRLDQLGLHPGTRVEVILIEPVDGLITIATPGNGEAGENAPAERVTIGQTTAAHLYVDFDEVTGAATR